MRAFASSLLPLALGLLASPAPGASAAPLGAITEYSAALAGGSDPSRIVSGPDGNLWFTDESKPGAVGRVTAAGTVTEFSAGLQNGSEPFGIATGSEGDLWFTDRGRPSAVGRLAPGGPADEFSAGLPSESFLWSNIVQGPEGDMWFVDQGALGAVGRVTPSGQITEFPEHYGPRAIALGSDGNLWVANSLGFFTGSITRVTPGGEMTNFQTGLQSEAYLLAIAPGLDGNVWFADDGPTRAIGRITPSGQITEFTAGLPSKAWIFGLAAGPDGAMWFSDQGNKAVGRITPEGTITEYETGTNPVFGPSSITPGPDGQMWFAGENGSLSPILGEVGTGSPAALVSSPLLSGTARPGSSVSCAPAGWSTYAGEQPSPSLFAYDGFRWLRDGAPVGTGTAYTPSAADSGHDLSCQETVTYPAPLLVNVVGSSMPVRVAAVPPVAPVLGAVSESATRWREGSSLASIASRTRQRSPVGTSFSFTLNESSVIRLAFQRLLPGRRSGGRCVAANRAHARGRACTRSISAGTLALQATAGADSLKFQGRLARTRRLPRGSYLVGFVAEEGGRTSAAHRLRFSIVGG